MDINKLKLKRNNPRQISKEALSKLKDSIQRDPEFMEEKAPPVLNKQKRIPWNKGIKMWEGREHPRGTLGMKGLGLGRKHSEESKAKMSAAHKGSKRPWAAGKNCHFWNGGITKKNETDRKRVEYKKWRDAVFERDEYICQICKIRGGQICSHHIKTFSEYPDLRFDIANGQTLCIGCHAKVHDTCFIPKPQSKCEFCGKKVKRGSEICLKCRADRTKKKYTCPACGKGKREHRIICIHCEAKETAEKWKCIECGSRLKGKPLKIRRRCMSCSAKLRQKQFGASVWTDSAREKSYISRMKNKGELKNAV